MNPATPPQPKTTSHLFRMDAETATRGGELHPTAAAGQPLNRTLGQCSTLSQAPSMGAVDGGPDRCFQTFLFHYIVWCNMISSKQQKTEPMMVSLSLLSTSF